MKNLCQATGCMYWQNDIQRTYGCSRFLSASGCPISHLRNVEPTQYELYCDPAVFKTTLVDAMALCPDPIVKLKTMALEPVESLERQGAYDRLTGDNRADRIVAAISGITIGVSGENNEI